MSTTPNQPEPLEPERPGPGDPVEGGPVPGEPISGEPITGEPVLEDPVFDEPVLETAREDETVTVRRAPRYGSFMLLGGIVGAVAALVLTFAFPANELFDRGQVFGFLLIALAAAGVALGAVAALVADRALARRAGSAIAEREATLRIDD